MINSKLDDVKTLNEFAESIRKQQEEAHGEHYCAMHDTINKLAKDCKSYKELGVHQGGTLANALLQPTIKYVEGIDISLEKYNAYLKPIAESYAKELVALNNERREIESKMHAEALNDINLDHLSLPFSICLYNKSWHQGVIGILASRMKEKYSRPTIIFALDESGLLKGSGRSISGLHLRDTLDVISKKNSNLIKSFGGHAMAAGLTIEETNFDLFVTIFEQTCTELLTEEDLNTLINVDESILDNSMNFDIVKKIDMSIWGQGFKSREIRQTYQSEGCGAVP